MVVARTTLVKESIAVSRRKPLQKTNNEQNNRIQKLKVSSDGRGRAYKSATWKQITKSKELTQVQVGIQEFFKNHEITKPLATKELVWFMASAFLALPIFLVYRLLSYILGWRIGLVIGYVPCFYLDTHRKVFGVWRASFANELG
ncbi:hypothetical protein ZIOFF_074720 [Zingiber officinale]|uniref:Uncharacterized protein n=1 Tax=Zingiber officinale TaxID=94328 RepID=A0A8J5CQW2_ZINOF|nr:hypothetical protein ZIOFF_074720 [Zingiber officinale]